MKSRRPLFLGILKFVGAVLMIFAIADAAELLEKGTLLEILIVPFIWIPGALMLVIGFSLEEERRWFKRYRKKDLKIELEGRRR